MGSPERAVAVVVRNHQVLVVDRLRAGMSYAVLPGGGVESGESAEAAVARELEEETGLTGRVGQVLWVRDDGGRRATYFLIEHPEGSPRLGGPERERASPDNRYVLRWVGADDFGDLDLRPREIAPLVRDLLSRGQAHAESCGRAKRSEGPTTAAREARLSGSYPRLAD
jgi:8-oxo-dGTP diphosphatase